MRKAIAIMGIHTGIGKTIVSAILAEGLQADYWKPVQAGDLQNSDSKKVKSLLSNTKSTVHPEAVRLNHPLSPHEAARLDGVEINFELMVWPKTPRYLLVETAGGVMSPINDEATMVDFVSFYNLPVVLVVRHYLGSINHTLMSIDVLKGREIKVLGLIISGHPNPASQSFISAYSRVPILAQLPEMPVISASSVREVAHTHRTSLQTVLEYANA
ncbi:MAG TPA: dethiobiotin synthase [Cyclobacteriaceae bacterium]|nr:dethiobiotin synthase [Cyclobacteriaceae bacterium]